MSTQALYYRHSGQCTTPSLFSTLAIAVVAAVILGPIYGIIVYYMPLVYINALLTFGLGIVLGLIIKTTAMSKHIRSLPMVMLIALVAGLVAEYAAFVGWLLAVRQWSPLVVSPGQLFSDLEKVAEVGVWSFKSTTVKGGFLIGIWGIEAIVVVGATIYFAYDEISKTPYCETCLQWLPNKTMVGPFEKVSDPVGLRASLEQGEFGVLGNIKPLAADAGAAEFTDYELTDCPTCPDMAVVSIRNVTLVADKNGNVTPKIQAIVDRMLIDHDSCELIKQLGPQAETVSETAAKDDSEEPSPTEKDE